MSPGRLLMVLGRVVSAVGVWLHSRSMSVAAEWWACGEVRLGPPK